MTNTQKFNHRHKKVGHLFQGRYKAILCQKETYLLELIRYIVLNPVRAHLVKEPTDWRWRSLAESTGKPDNMKRMNKREEEIRQKKKAPPFERIQIESAPKIKDRRPIKGAIKKGSR